MRKKKYIFTKTNEVDKEKFAELLLAAKGGRTMKDFADLCGANPSTFTRIVQKANKGASSPELLEAIAEKASPESGVTIEALAEANGYSLKQDIGLRIDALNFNHANAERLSRDVLTQALMDRNQEVRMGNIRYNISKHLELRPDVLIMTEAFGNENEVWFIESMPLMVESLEPRHVLMNARRRAFDRISRFVFISMNNVELFRPTRFSLVVYDKAVYETIVEEFYETIVPTDISIILIDPFNSVIIDEVMLPHISKGRQPSYFMNTETEITFEDNYLTTDDDEEE